MLVRKQKTYALLDADGDDDDDGGRSSVPVVSESRKPDSHKKRYGKKILSQEDDNDELIAQEEEKRRVNMMGQVVDAGAFNLDGVTISFAEAIGLKRRIQVCSVQGPPKGDDRRETPSLSLRRFKEIGRFLGRLELYH
ncbi:unnamed protein product [Malus baccata var. baccata]